MPSRNQPDVSKPTKNDGLTKMTMMRFTNIRFVHNNYVNYVVIRDKDLYCLDSGDLTVNGFYYKVGIIHSYCFSTIHLLKFCT